MTSVERLNQLADFWGLFIGIKSIDILVIFLIVFLVWTRIRKQVPAQIGYLLFLLVLIKPILPTHYALPVVSPLPNLFAQEQRAQEPSITDLAIQNSSMQDRSLPELVKQKQTDRNPPIVLANDDIKREEAIPKKTPIQDSQKEALRSEKPVQPSVSHVLSTVQSVPKNRTVADPSVEKTKESSSYFSQFNFSSVRSLLASVSIVSMLMMAWGATVLILWTKFLYVEWKTFRLIQHCESVHPRELGMDFEGLRTIAGVKRAVRLVSSPWIQSPLVYGIFSPVLLIPQGFTDQYSEKQARWILLHEFAHIRRWDTLVKLFQKAIQFGFFFHPAVWIASRIVDQQREFACDDCAVLRANISPHDCGESYLRVVFQSNCMTTNFVKSPAPGLLGLNHSKRIVKERLMNILDQNRKRNFRISPQMMVSLIVIMVIALSFGGAVKADNPAPLAQPAEIVQVVSAASSDSSATVQTSTFSTGDFTVSEKKYIWTRELQGKAENFDLLELVTEDGDIVIQSKKDTHSSTIDAQAKIIIQSKNTDDTLSESEALAVKEKVDVIVETDSKSKKLKIRSKILNNLPEGINVSIDLVVNVPASLVVHAKSEDGDLVANDIQAPIELRTEDGDIAVKGITGSMALKTEDGDIHASGCAGPIAAKTEDGDIVLEQVSKEVNAKTEDGDIILSYSISPLENCSAKTEDGSIVITLPEGSKATLDLTCGEGDIAVTDKGFEGNRDENKEGEDQEEKHVTGTLSGGGPTIQAQTEDGDIAIINPE